MQKILRKRVRRDLKDNLFRYLALGLLIVLAMYIVISIVAAADTIITGTQKIAEENKCEDGQFSVFTPLTKMEEQEITDKGITLEKMFFVDFLLKDDSILRVYQSRKNINLITLNEGKMAEEEGELVLERRYAEEHKLGISDKIQIGNETFSIVGIGCVPDYEAPYKEFSDSAIDSNGFGVAFVTEEMYEILKKSEQSEKTESYCYAYLLNGEMTDEELREELKRNQISPEKVTDEFFKEYWDRTGGKKDDLEKGIIELVDGAKELENGLKKLADYESVINQIPGLLGYAEGVKKAEEGAAELSVGTTELKEQTDQLLKEYMDTDLSNLVTFLKAEDNQRVGAAGNKQIVNKLCGIIAGIIAMILFTYVISVFVIHGIEKECSVIGALYALGVKRRDLICHYLMLPVIVTFIAGIIGTILGFSNIGIPVQMKESYSYFSLPELNMVYPTYLILYSVVMPPIVAMIVNYFVIRKHLSRTVLSLLRKEQKENKVSNIKLGNMKFMGRFQVRQMLREIRTGFTVIFGMCISLLIMMIGLDTYVMVQNLESETKEDTRFEYMYTYKYPEENVPEGGEEAFAKTLKREIYGYNLEVTLLGIKADNPYFDANVEKGEDKVAISSAVAQKYRLELGDEIVLRDEEKGRNYAFLVTDVVQYGAGLYVFMDIDSMRTLFGEGEDYYNVVFSDYELEIPSGKLYAITTKDNIARSPQVFMELLTPLITMMCTVSLIIFCVIMYLMLKVMIDRSAFGISLVKIFGYRTKEIRKLYLNGNFYIIAIGGVVTIPLAKQVMDKIFPYMIYNVACGMNLKFSWQLYIGIFGVVILFYLIINQILVHKVKKIVLAEALKNRE